MSSSVIDETPLHAPATAAVPRRSQTSSETVLLWLHRLTPALCMVVLAAVISVAGARVFTWAWTQPVSFDGAMNLEVARSLAEGNGYQRLYADHSGFSHEIQTRAPYILPAAAVFRLFGVGIWQAQFVNLVYLCALALIAFFLLRRWASWRWGVLAVAALLCTPGIEDIGLNGYGEAPALAWWLGALLVLYPLQRQALSNIWRCGVAGALVGIAVVTKTVLLIGLVAVLPVFAVECMRRGSDWRRSIGTIAALLAGVLLPIALHEVWRVLAMGGASQWSGWLGDELHAVHMQAGTQNGYADTPMLYAKFATHLGVLAKSVGVPPWLLVPWLIAPFALLFCVRRRVANPVVVTLALFTFVYFLWWLGMTPTQKAWYRRIFDGMIGLELLLVLVGALMWRARNEQRATAARFASAVTVVVLLALQTALAWASFAADRPSSVSPHAALDEDLAALQKIPADARLYGLGWYSNPVAALYSGRRSDDLSDVSPASFAARPEAFLLLDRSLQSAQRAAFWLQRYPSEQIAGSGDLRIVRLATDRVRDPFAGKSIDAAQVRGYVDFHAADYPYDFGFHEREGDGWRWAGTDVEALLRYSGETAFKLDMYMPSMRGYVSHDRLDIDVWIDACRLGTIHQDQDLHMHWWLPMRQCAPEVGQIVRVRLVSDNLVKSDDDRQIAFVAHGLGFDKGPAQP